MPIQAGKTAFTVERHTIGARREIEGITLFTGARSRISLLPSPGPAGVDPGIWFRSKEVMIAASASSLVPETRRTVLSAAPGKPGTPAVQTVEHLLSALAGMYITDAIVEIEGPEVPVGDGSAKEFVDAIRGAGVVPLRPAASSSAFVIDKRLEVVEERDGSGRTLIVAEPLRKGDDPGLYLRYDLHYEARTTGVNLEQSFETFLPLDPHDGRAGNYAWEIAPARTFCTFAEAKAMRDAGMFAHLTPRDMLVLGPDAKPIDNELRFENEPARHKVLDIIGDLSLGPWPLVGRVHAMRTGHAHNHRLSRLLGEQVKA